MAQVMTRPVLSSLPVNIVRHQTRNRHNLRNWPRPGVGGNLGAEQPLEQRMLSSSVSGSLVSGASILIGASHTLGTEHGRGPQCLLLTHGGMSSDRQSSDFRAVSDSALQVFPALQTYGGEPASWWRMWLHSLRRSNKKKKCLIDRKSVECTKEILPLLASP